MDATYLEQALALAELGRGLTSPNPVVGAVIVRNGEVLGEGSHMGAGLDHAEIAAIKDAVRRAGAGKSSGNGPLRLEAAKRTCQGATMYVTLEPCCTQGRTPPCTVALIESGIIRVVVGAGDPSPAVDGKGVARLIEAGVQVEVAQGGLSRRAKRQNDGMRKTVTRGVPFVNYKYAISVDGRMCTDSGDACWVSSAESRRMVHQWRAWSDAVLVGANTAEVDDPLLTAREVDSPRQPLRVVVDRDLRLKADSRLARSTDLGPVLVVSGENAAESARLELESCGVQTCAVPVGDQGEPDPAAVCRELAHRNVQSVLLEGGARLAGSWWAAGLVDKISAFVCPTVISGERGGGSLRGPGVKAMTAAKTLVEVEVQTVGPDVLVTGYREGPF